MCDGLTVFSAPFQGITGPSGPIGPPGPPGLPVCIWQGRVVPRSFWGEQGGRRAWAVGLRVQGENYGTVRSPGAGPTTEWTWGPGWVCPSPPCQGPECRSKEVGSLGPGFRQGRQAFQETWTYRHRHPGQGEEVVPISVSGAARPRREGLGATRRASPTLLGHLARQSHPAGL